MKSIAIFFFLFYSFSASSQSFELLVKSPPKNVSDTPRLNIPFHYGYYKEHDRLPQYKGKGNWSFSIPCSHPSFGELYLIDQSHTILMIPGQQLTLVIDTTGTILNYSGNAAETNKLVSRLGFNKIPFFGLKGSADSNEYVKIPFDDVQAKVVAPWIQERDQKLNLIRQSRLSASVKKLLESEVIYHALNELNYYSRGIARMKRDNLIRFYIATFDTLPPTRFASFPGPQFHLYAENYIGLMEAKAFQYYQQQKLTGKDPLPYFGVSMDSGTALINEKGKIFLNWLAAKKNFDTLTASEYIAQKLESLYLYKDLKQYRSLLNDFKTYHPASAYLPNMEAHLKELNGALVSGQKDSTIIVWKDYQKVESMKELLESFRGKVVYLDIWGTWCGPCKQELKFTPELKKRFEGKDVVFIYLDMDDDIKDADWREFIRVNGMSGIHVRKNKTTILPFWEELLPKDKENQGLYPTYFIFDRLGKLVVPRAARPSDRDILYQQIEAVLQ